MKTYLITGGAGFIGCNYAARLLQRGERVIIYDNLSRSGAQANVDWLQSGPVGGGLDFLGADVRDYETLCAAVHSADVVVHLAAQVAVTSSLLNPREDFAINALGTLNVLEAARSSTHPPIVIYASTNKVYGDINNVEVIGEATRYRFASLPKGIDEEQPLDFHSPYGCSKGSADQYVRDYQRIYGLPTVVLRQSCIYGPRQHGIADQGWVAWFMIAALRGEPISIYGDGKQVRDLLHIDDLLDVYDLVVSRIDVAAGQVFNVGGGASRSLSVWAEFGPRLEALVGRQLPVHWRSWRQGDQRVYISDLRKLETLLGWQPKIDLDTGLAAVFGWIQEHHRESG